jgi:hypothetical protein
VKLLWQILQANLFPITRADSPLRYREYLFDQTADGRPVKIKKKTITGTL